MAFKTPIPEIEFLKFWILFPWFANKGFNRSIEGGVSNNDCFSISFTKDYQNEIQARRESRLRRMKLLEQRRNVLCGETTDDNEERNEQVQRERTKRSKKYTRSKTDGNAAEMRAAMLSKK